MNKSVTVCVHDLFGAAAPLGERVQGLFSAELTIFE